MRHTLVALFLIILSLSGCSTDDPFVSTFQLKDKWLLLNVVTPDYPFNTESGSNAISLSFPKQAEYELFLNTFKCTGTYQARQNGDMLFKRSNCTEGCCLSEYDRYIYTLMKKVKTFTYQPNDNLQLLIDERNYLVFGFEESTDIF